MGRSPLISVVMPVRDAERYIADALTSVLCQTVGDDIEVIVIDDASTDNSASIVETFRDERIRILRNDRPHGVTRCLNRGLAEATAPLIARMDADDVCHPDRFRRQAVFLQDHLDVGILATWCSIIDTQGKTIGEARTPQDHDILSFTLYFQCPIVHSSVMMRTSTLRAAGGYDNSVPFAQDTELWLRLAPSVHMGSLGEFLLSYRWHPLQVGHRHSSTQRNYASQARAKALDALLDRELPRSIARYWDCLSYEEPPNDEQEAITLMDLILDVVDAFVRKRNLEGDSERRIRREGRYWLLKLARLCAPMTPTAVPKILSVAQSLRTNQLTSGDVSPGGPRHPEIA